MSAWSEHNKVPTVAEYNQIEHDREESARMNHSIPAQSAAEEAAPGSKKLPPEPVAQKPERSDEGQISEGAKEKERLKKAAQSKNDKPAQSFQAKGERTVRDPITGQDVVISDASKDTAVDQTKLDPTNTEVAGYSTNVPGDEKAKAASQSTLYTTPHPAQPTSILLQRFPPPIEPPTLKRLDGVFSHLAQVLAVALSAVWFFTAFGAGWFRFFLRTSIFVGVGVGGFILTHLASRKLEKELLSVRMEMERQRGEENSPPYGESAEWLNAAIACIWKQIDPAMFIPIGDMVEDIMQQSLPGFISAVKLSDIGIGDNPFRFVALRGLPDMQGDKEYPREEWIHQGKPDEAHGGTVMESAPPGNAPLKPEDDQDGDGIADEDESGDFLNYEISFSYSSRPGADERTRSKNIHLLIQFFLGALDLFRFPINIWAQVEHISGTIRLRAQIVQTPPYIRNLTFTLMGVPRVEISVVPLAKALPNVLDLPLISGFVQSSIAAACNMYVAPKSMTLNLGQMLSGGGVKKDTDNVGVLVVRILHAKDLSAQDAGGKSDPYIVLSFARFGRPLYSSRIIFEDLNPVFVEEAYLLVSKDDIRSDEQLSVQLWDSDKRTADDIQGRVTEPLKDLMKTPNKMTRRTDDLKGFEEADKMQGTLTWEVGYFEKAALNRALQKKAPPAAADAKKKKEEDEKKSAAEKEKDAVKEQERQDREAAAAPMDSAEEADALTTPPDHRWKSGIFSLTIDHISGLERRQLFEKGVMGKEREGPSGQDVDKEAETESQLPNSYCEILINSQVVYKTRVKMLSNMPFFAAGSEFFIKNWQDASVQIVVRDARTREHDPILGIVDLDLEELFAESSVASGSYSLGDGIGYGKVYIQAVFKAVKLDLAPERLGWDTVTVELIDYLKIEGVDEDWTKKLQGKKITVSTGDDTEKVESAEKQEVKAQNGDIPEPFLRLPCYARYSTNLVFEIGKSLSVGPFGGAPEAIAVLNLSDIPDDEVRDLKLPILVGDNLGTLARNYINDVTAETHKYEVVGHLSVKVRVDPGLSFDHEGVAQQGGKQRHEYEIYNRLEGMPARAEENAKADEDGVIDSAEKKEINDAKKEALHARHRGAYGYTTVRESKWAVDNLKYKARKLSRKLAGKQERDQTVASEA
ncbi:hypothetical protein OC846_001795 [Tilletia horrida]|uniref:C2 domain-containing protein n=1 Tax=Tilletia horrida TaxID=155126 RepID=A0AAN6JZJ9_9BASI|nr:hypothetical protein OC846_001795 [Tilletia horrida]